MGLCVTPSLMLVDIYFKIYRLMVRSFVASGSSLGTIIIPGLLLQLHQKYGLGEMAAMMGFLMLTISLQGLFMKCAKTKQVEQRLLIKLFQSHPLGNLRFQVLCMGNFLWSFGISVSYTYIPVYLVALNNTSQAIVLVLAVMGASGLFIKLSFASLNHFHEYDITSSIVCIVIGFVLAGLCPQLLQKEAKFGYAIIFGIQTGYWSEYLSSVSIQDVGPLLLISGAGWIMISVASGLSSGIIFSAVILDLTKNFEIIFHLSGEYIDVCVWPI